MKYLFYPGCSLESTAKDFMMSAQCVAQSLGIELQKMPDWTCCGSTPAHSTDELLAIALPARNLLIAQSAGLDLAVCCASCYGRLGAANIALAQDHRLQESVAEILGQEYKGNVHVRHLLQILYEDVGISEIRDAVTHHLKGLKIACYYGCLLTRPRELSISSDPEDPTIMEEILQTTGAEMIDWPYKTECCGANFSITRPSTVERLVSQILRAAKDSGANCLAVACPLCQINLDLRQQDIQERFNLPVFYFTQVLGLAFGVPRKQLGIGKLMVSPDEVLAGTTTGTPPY